MLFYLVQGFTVTVMTVGQVGLLLGRSAQVPAGQFQFVIGELLLALGGGLVEPGGHTFLEEVVVHAPKVNVERTFGGRSDGLL